MGKILTLISLLFGLIMTAYWFYLKSYYLVGVFAMIDVVLVVILLTPVKGGDIEEYVEA